MHRARTVTHGRVRGVSLTGTMDLKPDGKVAVSKRHDNVLMLSIVLDHAYATPDSEYAPTVGERVTVTIEPATDEQTHEVEDGRIKT